MVVEKRILRVFRETLLGPKAYKIQEDFAEDTASGAFPNFKTEGEALDNFRKDMTVQKMVSFEPFTAKGKDEAAIDFGAAEEDADRNVRISVKQRLAAFSNDEPNVGGFRIAEDDDKYFEITDKKNPKGGEYIIRVPCRPVLKMEHSWRDYKVCRLLDELGRLGVSWLLLFVLSLLLSPFLAFALSLSCFCISHFLTLCLFVSPSLPPSLPTHPPHPAPHTQPFEVPVFGVTMLGVSHGFDSKGKTTGFVLWLNRKGIMVDPPFNSSRILEEMGIPPQHIDGIILSHCHADHDAGAFQKILRQRRVKLYTSKTIRDSFMRKYAALTGFTTEFLENLFIPVPIKVGE